MIDLREPWHVSPLILADSEELSDYPPVIFDRDGERVAIVNPELARFAPILARAPSMFNAMRRHFAGLVNVTSGHQNGCGCTDCECIAIILEIEDALKEHEEREKRCF